MKPELKVALEQAENLKKELLSAEENAENSSVQTYGKKEYPFMFGYISQSCKSATIRLDYIIELMQNSLQ